MADELTQTAFDFVTIQRWFIDVGNAQLERGGVAESDGRDLGEFAVRGV